MVDPHIFGDKVFAAYVWFANAVASEGAVTDHAKRLVVARAMVSDVCVFDKFVKADFVAQGYDSTTDQASLNNRLSALATNLVALGFGG
jgi:hypothetical protein